MQREEEEGTEMIKGTKRFRQAIKNQQDFGNGEFRLSFADVEAICKECEDENLDICMDAERQIGRYVWAFGVPAPVDADGNVVPLTTKVMYDDDGEECRIDGFRLSLDPSASSTWRAGYVVVGFDADGYVKDLHLHRPDSPDSWERLEKDIERIGSGAVDPDNCYYFDEEGMKCSECPAKDSWPCSRYIARDVLRRAKALAGRNAKAFAPQPSPHDVKEATND